MGLRFHKSIRLLPFVRLNLSKSGFSLSLGAPGASLNLGPKGARGSLGIPGSGLSYRKSLGGGQNGAWRALCRVAPIAAAIAVGLYILARIA